MKLRWLERRYDNGVGHWFVVSRTLEYWDVADGEWVAVPTEVRFVTSDEVDGNI
jgi:hypothetical protein